MSAVSEDLLIRQDGAVGLITLNRPKSINSLTHTMVIALHKVLSEWALAPEISAVVLDGAGERGLCAGGDIVAIYHDAVEGGAKTREFWFDEYRLNAFIAAYPKPYVSLMDGLVMGGGVGIGAHGSVRIVTEKSKVAMPEVGIGFVPDVGGTYLLSRAPGLTGLHMGLTGIPISGADAVAVGFADHIVPQDRLGDFTKSIVTDGVKPALDAHTIATQPSPLMEQRWISECYNRESVLDIVAALRRHEAEPANAAADLIATRSPIALAVTLESLRRAAQLKTLKDVLVQEYRVSCAALDSQDFVEGIRAQVIDKDRTPKWSPSSVAAVREEHIERYFAPCSAELSFE
jgi:enoyl-CoA hydratase